VEDRKDNLLVSISVSSQIYGIACLDLTSGKFNGSEALHH